MSPVSEAFETLMECNLFIVYECIKCGKSLLVEVVHAA